MNNPGVGMLGALVMERLVMATCVPPIGTRSTERLTAYGRRELAMHQSQEQNMITGQAMRKPALMASAPGSPAFASAQTPLELPLKAS
jgi:hypothetical protein